MKQKSQGSQEKKFKGLIFSLVLTMAVLLAPVALAAGTEDPYYQNWTRFKVGANVTLTGTAINPQGKSSFKQTVTLKEVQDQHQGISIQQFFVAKTGYLLKSRICNLKVAVLDYENTHVSVIHQGFNKRILLV